MCRLLHDKIYGGWLAWTKTNDSFLAPDPIKSTYQPWDDASEDAVNTIRTIVTSPAFWEKLATHYSAENHSDVISQDNASCVKSICEFAVSHSLIQALVLTDMYSSSTTRE